MAAVESACDVGRRQGDDETLFGPGLMGTLGLEETALLPPLVPRGFDGLGRVGLEVRVGLVVEGI